MEAWYGATSPSISGAGNTRYDGFGYDALGNRTQNNYVASRGLTSFIRRDNGLNQYSSWSPSIIYHDDNSPWSGYNAFPGNGVTMAEGWLVASYNALNQPVAMVPFGWGDAVFFGYDPLGRCVKRWIGSSGDVYSNPATYFHYDGWNLLQEGNNAWGPSRVYVHGNRMDEIVWSYNTFTGEQAFHQYDARGHCTLLTDSGGGILEQYEYDAFGQPYFYDASGNSIGAYDAQGRWAGYSLFGNRFLFTGREWLSDLKVYDYRNRMYQPELGRFMQPDPKEFAAGDYNLYRYCHNDPVNKSDPFGLLEVYYWPSSWVPFVPGHISMRLEDGTYISAWPKEPGPTGRLRSPDYAKDAKEAGAIHERLKIDGLNEAKIKGWWQQREKEGDWSLLGRNCSEAVTKGLREGGLPVGGKAPYLPKGTYEKIKEALEKREKEKKEELLKSKK